jgi:hypothetical protein
LIHRQPDVFGPVTGDLNTPAFVAEYERPRESGMGVEQGSSPRDTNSGSSN